MLAQKEEEVLTFVEEEAQYPGGMGEMIRFLQENLKYPEDAWKAGIQGKAVIRFIVEKMVAYKLFMLPGGAELS